MPRPFLGLNSVVAIAIVSTSVNLAFAEVRTHCIDARQSDDIRAGEICQSEWRRAQCTDDTMAAAQAPFQLAILARCQGEFTRAENHLQSIALMPGIDRDWPTQYRLSREQGILAP